MLNAILMALANEGGSVVYMGVGETLASLAVELTVLIILVSMLICMAIVNKKGENTTWVLLCFLGPIGVIICCFCDKINAALVERKSAQAESGVVTEVEVTDEAETKTETVEE